MTIKVIETIVDVRFLYKEAVSPNQKALVGYMIKSGNTLNPIFGGAFNILRGIEKANRTHQIYNLYYITDNETAKKIIYIAQMAMDKKFEGFAFTDKEYKEIPKMLCEF